MSIELETVGGEGLGAFANDRFVEAAITSARELVEAAPDQARWILPLVRAIRLRRLRLPALDPTTHRVIRLIDSPEVKLDELAAAVSGDPVLSTRIMGVANSSYFRGASEVLSVRDALMRMGVREARTLVVVVALRSTLLRSPGLGQMAMRFWRHSLLTASATQEITQELPPWEVSGFIAGLLQDLGHLVVLAFAAELPAWQEDGSAPTEDAVSQIIGATHAALGALVLASWGFPEPFCDAVLAHHAPETIGGEAALLARAMELGDAIAEDIERGWSADPALIDPALVELGERLGLDRARLADIAAEAETSLEALYKLS
jgi:HD-like signal output (HDOD) protein